MLDIIANLNSEESPLFQETFMQQPDNDVHEIYYEDEYNNGSDNPEDMETLHEETENIASTCSDTFENDVQSSVECQGPNLSDGQLTATLSCVQF